MTYERLLVPVDGSDLTDRAIEASLGLARQLGAAVVAYVAEPLLPLPTSLANKSDLDRALQAHEVETEAHARPLLERFAAAAAGAGVAFEGVFEQAPDIDRAIAAAAERLRCDMIVMVTHGRGTFGELLFGSHTKAVLSATRIPVLVLH